MIGTLTLHYRNILPKFHKKCYCATFCNMLGLSTYKLATSSFGKFAAKWCILSAFRGYLCTYLQLKIYMKNVSHYNAGVTLSRFWLPMDTRWRKFATSGMIVNTSGHSGMHPKPSCVHRLSFLGFGSSFGSVHKIFGMSKNCRRSSRSCTFAWTSCVLLVHRMAIVRPSCVHPVGSCGHRLYFV